MHNLSSSFYYVEQTASWFTAFTYYIFQPFNLPIIQVSGSLSETAEVFASLIWCIQFELVKLHSNAVVFDEVYIAAFDFVLHIRP